MERLVFISAIAILYLGSRAVHALRHSSPPNFHGCDKCCDSDTYCEACAARLLEYLEAR
jgi:hypothetical protein